MCKHQIYIHVMFTHAHTHTFVCYECTHTSNSQTEGCGFVGRDSMQCFVTWRIYMLSHCLRRVVKIIHSLKTFSVTVVCSSQLRQRKKKQGHALPKVVLVRLHHVLIRYIKPVLLLLVTVPPRQVITHAPSAAIRITPHDILWLIRDERTEWRLLADGFDVCKLEGCTRCEAGGGVHLYVCMYVYVCVCMCVRRCLQTWGLHAMRSWGWGSPVCVYVCMCVCMYVCTCVCVWRYYVCMHTSM